MARLVKLRCLGCGYAHTLARFGIVADGDGFTFDPDRRPDYDGQLRIDDMGGRGHLAVHQEPMPLAAALALRASLARAVELLDAEIKAAGES